MADSRQRIAGLNGIAVLLDLTCNKIIITIIITITIITTIIIIIIYFAVLLDISCSLLDLTCNM